VLQCVAVCCSVLKCVGQRELEDRNATHYSTLQQISICVYVYMYVYIYVYVATPGICIYVATHCNTLQHTATHYNMHMYSIYPLPSATAGNLLQHTATNCRTLQHTATHCSTLRYSATQCNTMQRTAIPCNAL